MSNNNEMKTVYSPKEIEEKIYDMWIKNDCFKANPNNKKKPYTIIMPPPNVTGKLHMGHALDISLQDSLIRYKRMKGYEALWQPGTDHAAISTEIKVVDKLKSKGIDKHDLGREGFLKEAWKWKEEYEHNIIDQQKKMGSSCDWSKLRFTMDEGCSKAVLYTFKHLYDKGLIYRGDKIVNYCPTCHTTISDAEVVYEEQDGALYHIKYYFKGEKDKYIVVATTRPETMLGDTAVAVNPKDRRNNKLIGKKVILPLVNRELDIIGDEYVDMDFGTGFVKMTPCHDPNDYQVGLRHNLEQISVIDDDGKIDFKDSRYHGMDRFEARKEIVKDLKEQGFIEKIENHKHNVGTHDRCHTTIEPMVKLQWFVKMESMAKKAIEALKKGDLRFVPDNYKNTYLNWLNNIKDWCISRQIWWGHRIPVYYCNDCNKLTVSINEVKKCEHCGSKNIHQDEDTLDTWFSSALWPFSTLGWPDIKNPVYKYFYPTDTLVTGYDIIFFWVVRMVFSGLEQTKECPFKDVLIHGIVRDELGRKMSKSLNNGIDPLEVINEYGADALRLSLLIGNAPGNDMRYIPAKVVNARNFLNKVWNASRFILMNDNKELENIAKKMSIKELGIEDKWIIAKLNELIKEVNINIDKYELGIALEKIEKFIWEEFCDWYIELNKSRLYGEDKKEKAKALSVLKTVLSLSLKLLHPFCPFITEEIYSKFKKELIIKSVFPSFNKDFVYKNEKDKIEYVKDIIKSIRNLRAELNVKNSVKSKLYIITKNNKLFNETGYIIKNLASVSEIIILDNEKELENINSLDKFQALIFKDAKLYLPFSELVDIEKEKKRINDEIEKVKFEITRAEGMLNNKNFVEKAPKEKIDAEREKLDNYKKVMDDLIKNLNSL